MLKADYFKKSKILKIVNNAYKWIAYHLFDWFNNEGNDVVKNNNHNELYSALKELIKRFKTINLEDEIVLPDKSIKADGQCNMLFEICKKLKIINEFTGLNIDELFIQKNREIIRLIYHSQQRNVLNVYILKRMCMIYI